MASAPNPAKTLAHVRPVRPLHFPEQEPEEEHLGQSPRHYALGVLIYSLLRRLCGEEHAVSADTFVYWDASNPKRVRAPDAAIKVGLSASTLHAELSWKTWELGVPELVLELLSLSDTREKWTLAEKLEAYDQMGVREFVCCDFDRPEGQRLRVWDRIDGDFVERIVDSDHTPCVVLSQLVGVEIEWTVVPDPPPFRAALRILREGVLFPTEAEAEHALAEEARLRAEQEHSRAEREHSRAEQEHSRAEQERARAEEERSRADDATLRAEEERARADEAAARARALEERLRKLTTG